MGLYCEDIDTMLRIDLHVIRQIIYSKRSILTQQSIVDKSSSWTMLVGSNEGDSTTNMNIHELLYPQSSPSCFINWEDTLSQQSWNWVTLLNQDLSAFIAANYHTL